MYMKAIRSPFRLRLGPKGEERLSRRFWVAGRFSRLPLRTGRGALLPSHAGSSPKAWYKPRSHTARGLARLARISRALEAGGADGVASRTTVVRKVVGAGDGGRWVKRHRHPVSRLGRVLKTAAGAAVGSNPTPAALTNPALAW